MTFEDFSFGFPHIAHFPLDHVGRYFAMTKPLRIWDGETDKYVKFASLREMWDQGEQLSFVQAFRKTTGGRSSVAVFVNKKTQKVKTYFPKDIAALDKVRKGEQIK